MSEPRTTRRQFHRQAAALAAAPVLAAAAGAEEAPRPPTVAGALGDLVRLRFGRHLSDEQLRRVRGSVARNVRLAEALGRVALQNGDEPAFAFNADVP
jgi:hypothetical protein